MPGRYVARADLAVGAGHARPLLRRMRAREFKMPELPRRRRSLRLKDYDYSQPGAYFITICTHQRACLFGEISTSEMHLNDLGRVAAACWQDIPNHFLMASLDEWIVMPNHLHGILVLSEDDVGARHASRVPDLTAPVVGAGHARPLQIIVGSFKSAAAKRINEIRAAPTRPVWQRGYYEHVVRDERALNRIREYIAGNPARWAEDPENPSTGEHPPLLEI